jgi:hypothetical protein
MILGRTGWQIESPAPQENLRDQHWRTRVELVMHSWSKLWWCRYPVRSRWYAVYFEFFEAPCWTTSMTGPGHFGIRQSQIGWFRNIWSVGKSTGVKRASEPGRGVELQCCSRV